MAQTKQRNDLFKRLTTLFRGGPSVRRKVKAFRTPSASTAVEVFKKSYSQVYSNALNAYGQYDRMSRYSDFSEMEYTPEISSALDIYSEESSASDDKGQILHVYSENPRIREILNELFHDTLNVEHNLTPWTRNLCKYGDFFLFNDVHPEHGIINAFPMPVNEVEREEGWDPNDPLAVRFRWVTQGNQILEAWQVTHFRLTGNDAFLPYGSSVLESARRIWRQLILIEDAMLVYRVVRSPERRVFYIDVGSVQPEEISVYMEAAQSKLKRAPVIDKRTGRIDLRYNPMSVDEDYFIPVRGAQEGTKIDTLAGGQHISDIDDVEYIQKKLFAALKIPRAYLGYDESLSSKATLAQEDIRFSRTITKIQKILISELNKLAIIHLFAHGYEDDDLIDFTLMLSNPSSHAQQQKLELHRTKFEIAGSIPEGLVDRDYIRKEILSLSDDEIEKIEAGRLEDKRRDLQLDSEDIEGNELPDTLGGGGGGGGSGGLGGLGGGAAPGGEAGGEEEPDLGGGGGAGEEKEAGGGEEKEPTGGKGEEDLFAGDKKKGKKLLVGDDEPKKKQNSLKSSLIDDDEEEEEKPQRSAGGPVKTSNQLKRYAFNRKRRKTHGPEKTFMSDMSSIVKSDPDPLDRRFWRKNPFGESKSLIDSLEDDMLSSRVRALRAPALTTEMSRLLGSLRKRIDSSKKRPPKDVLVEDVDVDLKDDIDDMVDISLDDKSDL